MSANHAVGNSAGTRQGCIPVDHTIPVNFNSAANRKFLRITASPQKPVLLTMREVGGTAPVNGTSPTYKLGSTSNGVEFLGPRTAAVAGGAAPTALPLVKSVLTADTDLWIGNNFATAVATTGNFYLTATLVEINIADVNANAIP